MKKTLSFFVALVLSGCVVYAGGIEDPTSVSKIAVFKTSKGLFNLIYRGTSSKSVEVAIYNKNNELQFQENIVNKNGFSRPYNFSQLAQGEYTIVVKDGGKQLTERILHFPTKSTSTMQVIKVKEDQFLLAVSDNQVSYVTIRISNKNNTEVFEKSVVVDKQYAQLFKFSEKLDTYTFTLQREDGSIISKEK